MAELPVASFNWTGFYVGVGVGTGAVVHELSSPVLGPISFDGIGGEGIFGEVTVGYDYMFSNRFLIGAFVDGRLGNIGTSLDVPAGPLGVDLDLPYGFDAVLRAGYLMTPDTLAYVLGGYSWQQFDLSSNIPGFATDWDRSGYVLGVGLETVVSGNWTLKGEYRFAQYGTQGFFPVGLGGPNALEIDSSTHTFHVGANYRFGATAGGGVALETPIYNWTGFYIGAAAGAGAVVHNVSSPLLPGGVDFNGVGGEGIFGEAMVGYDYEFANGVVAGVLVDGRYSGISTEVSAGGGALSASLDADYGFDLLGRVGYKLSGASLAYVLGGYSWQHFEASATGLGSIDWDANGFSVGGGLETAVTQRATLGLEYRYSQYEGDDLGSGGLVELEPSTHTVRATFKYKLF